jgi:hypothetical protein
MDASKIDCQTALLYHPLISRVTPAGLQRRFDMLTMRRAANGFWQFEK